MSKMDIAGCLWSGDAWCENIPWVPTDDFPSQPFSNADGPWIFDLKFSPLWWPESYRHSVETILGILILFWVSLTQYNPLWCFWDGQPQLPGRPLGVDHEGEQLTHSQPFRTHRAPLFFICLALGQGSESHQALLAWRALSCSSAFSPNKWGLWAAL